MALGEPKKVDLSGFGFKRLSHIGRGHYASVQLVQELETERTFVAKCVSLATLSEHDQECAHQEVYLLQALRHPLIVAYHDSFLIDGANTLVIVMEYCDGGDLRKLIKDKADSGEHLPAEMVMTWFAQIASALRYIHSEKVLHRDLKTSNIFLTAGSSTIKLGDFGISRVFEGTTDAAVTMVGTPYYMSPEVCRNQPYGYKSDVWSLGCVLYELCMLKHAFESSSLMGLVYKIISDHYEPIPGFYPQELNNLIRWMLAKKAEDRPTVKELLADAYLAGYVEMQPLLASPQVAEPSATSGRVPPPFRSRVPQATAGGAEGAADDHPPGALVPVLAAAVDPQTRALVLASRVRYQLVISRLNWISALAAFDAQGDGRLPPQVMRTGLLGLRLGLSEKEMDLFVESLAPGPGADVPLASFEARLAAADASAEVRHLRSWARQFLEPIASQVAVALRAFDTQQPPAGVLLPGEFHEALRGLSPGASTEQLNALELLADKNLLGHIDYMRFADAFAAPPPPPPLLEDAADGPPEPPRLSPKGDSASRTFFTCTSGETSSKGPADCRVLD
eukprot:CAMPEP_0117524412 /NCGR_PEP_ID=MMETSP0784-20121206/35232_1 /TAXON_ID=39447 /ORGANISM="" /LENGTH=563 /DNA_ID=CAMNT_0005320559 /DNA_START=112 /DNA_END=1803 /DNA_ORIENTATION=+